MLLHSFNKSNAKKHACTYFEVTIKCQRKVNLRNHHLVFGELYLMASFGGSSKQIGLFGNWYFSLKYHL